MIFGRNKKSSKIIFLMIQYCLGVINLKITKRLEFKYLISYLDYLQIVNFIKLIMNHDKHGSDDAYNVTSIYLDDLMFSGASDKAFGNETHKKYRIRYYNEKAIKKLELKIKQGVESIKYSTSINEEVYQAILNQDLNVLEKHFDDDLIRRFTLDMLKNLLAPTCFIKYSREAYKDGQDNLRITFDHSLCGERFSLDETDIDFKLIKDTSLILEIKYEKYLPKTIKELLKEINLNQIAYSKYFMGFDSIAL